MTSILKVSFFPAATPDEPLELDAAPDAAIKLLSVAGIGPLPMSPLTTKSPGQEGETALDILVPTRVIDAQALIQTTAWSDFWEAQRAIGRAMLGVPFRYPVIASDPDIFALGRLLFERNGQGDVEIYAAPRSGPVQPIMGTKRGTLMAEWECPYPYFQDTEDTEIDFPPDDLTDFENIGDVDAPIVAKIYGPATHVLLQNGQTSELFEVDVILDDDSQWLQVDTDALTVRKHYDVDDYEDAIAGLDLATSTFWKMRPGTGQLGLNVTGDTVDTHCVLTFRNRYSGL